jgi:hypothetical protein
MKVLLISNGNDVDLIIEDGGYAFLWLGDGKIKVDLHQGRISRRIEDDEDVEVVAHESCDKTYFMEFDGEIITDEMLDKVLNWLVVGKTISDFEITRMHVGDINTNDTINSFLNL